MKILITGASGYVGSGLLKYLCRQENIIIPTGFNLGIEDSMHNLDLTDFAATNSYIRGIKPDIIIHLAGNKDVFKCESDKILSRKINYEVSRNLIEGCSSRKIRLIYLSTDYVFGGQGAPFDESSYPKPTTQYGKDKLSTENLIREELKDYAIVRTAGIFGLKNDFVGVVIKHLKDGVLFNAYTNLKNTPTFIKDLALMLNIIIAKRCLGIFHCAGFESISRYNFAIKIARVYQLNKALIVPEEIDPRNDLRPCDLSMDSARTYNILNYCPQGIEDILEKNRDTWK